MSYFIPGQLIVFFVTLICAAIGAGVGYLAKKKKGVKHGAILGALIGFTFSAGIFA